MYPLTSNLCVDVWRTGYEFFLNPGNENWKLERKLRSFPRRLISTFTGKVHAFKLKLQTLDHNFCFCFWMVRNQLGGFFKPRRPLPPEIREEIVDFYNAGYSMNEVSRTMLVTRRAVLLSNAGILGLLLNHQ